MDNITPTKIADIVKKVALKEGKLKETPVGNVREMLAILSDLMFEDSAVIAALIANGKRRSKKGKK